MAGVNTVTAALAKAGHPEVELVRGEGYHYFVFDNTSTKSPGDELVYDSESVMTMHFRAYPIQRWIDDGIAFAEKIKGRIQ